MGRRRGGFYWFRIWLRIAFGVRLVEEVGKLKRSLAQREFQRREPWHGTIRATWRVAC